MHVSWELTCRKARLEDLCYLPLEEELEIISVFFLFGVNFFQSCLIIAPCFGNCKKTHTMHKAKSFHRWLCIYEIAQRIKTLCIQAWWLGFNYQVPQGDRRELLRKRCPVTSTCVPWQMCTPHPIHTYTQK